MDNVKAQVNLTTEKATIEYDTNDYAINDFVTTVQKLGYDVVIDKAEVRHYWYDLRMFKSYRESIK